MENAKKREKIKNLPPNIKIKYSFLKIFNNSDLSRRRLPFMSIESTAPGPAIFLTACIHGDEVSGIVIVQEVFKILRKILKNGSVHAFPLLNSIGFEMASRYISISEEDLNRSFPGKPNGTLAERVADKIFSAIIEKNPAVVLDLHNDWTKSIPYAFLDFEPKIRRTEAYNKSKKIAKKTGLPTVLDTEKSEGTLSLNLLQRGIPALTLELGEPYVINEKNVAYGVKIILNILEYMEMVAPTEKFFVYPLTENLKDKNLVHSDETSSVSGVIRFLVEPGEIVKKGRPVARIYNAFGKPEETITAKGDGVVLGHSDYSVSYPGASVMSYGLFSEEGLEPAKPN